ncbi:MAG: DUF4126 domain-containing protein [Chloroflexi bacterium]|nr:MAG: hypothetical protein B6I35_08940 [Anaerolineaceae bacterium 4572_32.2]RLC84365.1 MAG: DUF4126 domain-containing protein [Chloroflexota bacterium]HEY71992.1 DUF4126 domain-containing protein [Thermoflexia bacterium]
MGTAFLALATAFGLSTSAGLNAYIPLLVVALLARLTSLISLNAPYDALSSWWVIGVLGVLLIIEILVDKIPAADTANDIIQTFIRPAAGAILFAATTNTIGVHPVLAAVCGVILAGGVHAVKAGGRPVVASLTAGAGNPIVSTVEDAISLTLSLLAIVAPYLVAALLMILLALFAWWYARRRRRRANPW